MGLAGLLADSGRGQEGRGYMEQAAAIAPDNADVMSNMATYLWRIGMAVFLLLLLFIHLFISDR